MRANHTADPQTKISRSQSSETNERAGDNDARLSDICYDWFVADKYEFIVNNSRDFITLINREYIYEMVNDSYAAIVGRRKNEIQNRHVAEIWGEELFDEKLKGHLDKCFSGDEVHYIERFRFGLEMRYMHVSYYPYRDDSNDISHVLVFSHDITKLGNLESKLLNYEYRDPLTGLFNAKSLRIILEMEVAKARRSKIEGLRAALFFSISNLSEVNRVHGHSIGNVLLENTGVRMKEIIRESDYIFRYDGGELVVLLTSLAQSTDAVKVAEKIVDEIALPYRHNDFDIILKANVGIAIYPLDSDGADSLIDHALQTLREAEKNKTPYLLFDRDMYDASMQKLGLERDLSRAFFKNEFELFYQPIVRPTGVIVGCEALVRWRHPSRGVIEPALFLNLSEEIGLIKEIGKWVLYTATGDFARWPALYGSVNLTAMEFESSELLSIISNAVARPETCDGDRLKLEITESLGMSDPERTLTLMKSIVDAGYEIFIDDFGTGVSSLSYLKDLPASTLKIDRAFVMAVTEGSTERSFLEAIVALARIRGKSVIIEGVQTVEQFEIVRSLPVDGFQGYYFAEPLPADDFDRLLQSSGGTLP